MSDLKISVCVPTYNMGHLIHETIEDVLNQTYKNFELIISDNNSEDNTQEVVKRYPDPRIKYFRNEMNLGYFKNLEKAIERSSGDIVYLLSGKSKISRVALERTCNAFNQSDDIGAVTRAYYWYGQDVDDPVRAKDCYDQDLIVSIHDGLDNIIKVFHTLDNPAGLAFRRKYMDMPFSQDPFVEFTYPFASIMKKHKVVLLKGYTMACPAFKGSGSQKPLAYEKSPVQNWVDLFNTVFSEEEFREIREACIRNFVAVNYIGLVQVRNYAARYGALLREIRLMIKYRWQNLLNVMFWFFSVGTMVMPRKLLIALVEAYKKKVNAQVLKSRKICLEV